VSDVTSYELKPGDKMNFGSRTPIKITVATADGATMSTFMKPGTMFNIVCGTSPLTITLDDWDGLPDLKVVE
jgi:hypothetical protein